MSSQDVYCGRRKGVESAARDLIDLSVSFLAAVAGQTVSV